jgi:hypothetical protein
MTDEESAMIMLRHLRDQYLGHTEIGMNKGKGLNDKPFSDAEIAYRQALRDLPSTATPELDENGGLTNITWPEKPA